jgi:hypothetical protein
MEFTIAEETILLQGLDAPNLWEEKKFSCVGEGCHKGLWLQLLDNVVDTDVVKHGLELKALLGVFAELFDEPNGLPPFRSHDHAILLKSGS